MANEPHIQEMAEKWMHMQRDLLEEWSEQTRQMGSVEAGAVVDQTTETWKKAIEATAEMQRQWIEQLRTEIASMNEVSSDTALTISRSADEFVEWTKVQERFWKDWVDLIAKSIPVGVLEQGQKTALTMADAMQKGAQGLLNATLNVLGGSAGRRQP
ncbi:MAG: hypothetical protein ACOCSK_00045 [Rhodothermales bacterium]